MQEIIPENFKDYNSYHKASELSNQECSAMWIDFKLAQWNKLSKPRELTKDEKSVELKHNQLGNKDGQILPSVCLIDNTTKGVLDALEGLAYENDNQIMKLTLEICEYSYFEGFDFSMRKYKNNG